MANLSIIRAPTLPFQKKITERPDPGEPSEAKYRKRKKKTEREGKMSRWVLLEIYRERERERFRVLIDLYGSRNDIVLELSRAGEHAGGHW